MFTENDEPDHVGVITRSLLPSDHSYLAVQGLPESGKTHVDAHVIAALVATGWKVGVVAQSHAVIEHTLEKVVEAGVPKHGVATALRRELLLGDPQQLPQVSQDTHPEPVDISARSVPRRRTAAEPCHFARRNSS